MRPYRDGLRTTETLGQQNFKSTQMTNLANRHFLPARSPHFFLQDCTHNFSKFYSLASIKHCSFMLNALIIEVPFPSHNFFLWRESIIVFQQPFPTSHFGPGVKIWGGGWTLHSLSLDPVLLSSFCFWQFLPKLSTASPPVSCVMVCGKESGSHVGSAGPSHCYLLPKNGSPFYLSFLVDQ